MNDAALTGLQVLVTRPEGQADTLLAGLHALGATVHYAPTIRITDPPSSDDLDVALRQLDRYAWVVWTSANGVACTLARMNALGISASALRACRLAVIGAATARVLAAHGITADLVPPEAVAESLRDALLSAGVCAGQAVLLPQPLASRDVLAAGLRAAGVLVQVVPAYQTVENTDAAADVRRWLDAGDIDLAVVTSPSAVRGLLAMLGGDRAALARIPLACIGPVTAEAVRALGLVPTLVAADHTTDGLLAALVDYQTGVIA